MVIIPLDKNIAGTQITDELHANVGANAFAIEHDTFFNGADLVIRTAASGGGTLLVENTDYTVSGQDTDLSTECGKGVYTLITVTNVTRQTGNLYFTYKTPGDYMNANKLTTIMNIIDPLGSIKPFFGSTLPTRHLWVNGGSIGDASSGGTARANADTIDLYTILWGSIDNTNSQIKQYTSGGVLSGKGASAAADFAAHKRITLPDLRDNFLRGVPSAGRVVGNYQADAFQGHYHKFTWDNFSAAGSGTGVFHSSGYGTQFKTDVVLEPVSDGTNGTPRVDTETRPKNVVCNFIIRY